jgi:hypothetical protein
MNTILRIQLNTNAEQHARLVQLQTAFAGICNALSPTVQQTKVWNRVALHQIKYRQLREQFPDMGSQMVCNAIYSVSRTSRMVFQHPKSPFNLTNLGDRPLPLLRFSDNCPVYFDRHTLSVSKGQLSMYTLDGRLRFALALSEENETDFANKKLREIVLSRHPDDTFELMFQFGEEPADNVVQSKMSADSEFPEYVVIEEAQ